MSAFNISRSRLRVACALGAAAALASLAAFISPGITIWAQGPGPCAPPIGNPVLCENQKPGASASEWDIAGAGDDSIQGFATDISINRGQTIDFKISTPSSNYILDIYRLGYYGGLGARKVATISPSASLPQSQPACFSDASTGLIDCGGWAVSASWAVPADATSGIYFAKATRIDTGGASHIVFIVRDDASHSDLLFQTSDTTWQAYNQYGGNSLYAGAPGTNPGRAYKVSYNRPFTTRETFPEDWVFNSEYPMVRWLEANGYDTSYATGVDSERNGVLIRNHKVFMSVGHDEYWSGGQRASVEAARAAGVHLAFFSGNEVFWKTRWEPAMSADGTAYRTLVSYKETHANAKIDPQPNVWTGTWADPRFSPPADAGTPQNALTGTLFTVNCCTSAITVTETDGKLRFWRNTPIASLASGEVATLPDGTLGYEWDSDVDNGFRPAGLVRMSHTTVSGAQVLQDYGSTYGAATADHSITLYRHPSGALVFGAGTVQWSWGLDSNHDRGSTPPSTAMQQATVNLLADMGTQPLTIQADLSTAAPSADTLPPASTFVSPVNGSTVPPDSTLTITGHAADAGGGHVAGVEISVDGGVTWQQATGRDNWSFTWNTGSARSVSLFSRAVDDNGNLELPVSGVSVVVRDWSVTGPGGPILIATSSANPFTQYYAEILRAEGLNAFGLMDVSLVTPAILAQYDVVILGEMPLGDAQVTMFSDWVTAGGNLIAMRPDSKLASLLGWTGTASSLSDAYMQVDTSAAPGAGIVGQTMQFHGVADLHTLNGATALATLYSTATTATVNPAVAMRNVGSAGGQAAAFAYDLARSIVYTRQGNPAWSGQERDGQDPIRSDDLFFGGTQADYANLSKIAIPQADEQQRFLANLIGLMNSDRKPLPRFWYFPRGLKAVVVMTGDDHATGGTSGRFDIYNENSAPGCSVADWQCVRSTSYIYPSSPITPAQVAAYQAQGFEIAVHLRMSGPLAGSMDCNNFTPSSIDADYTSQLAQFAALFGSAMPVRTNRTHCVVWSDYDTQPQVAAAHGIRFDTNYYYWPSAWVNDAPGLLTGSAMPMRFAKTDGTTIDVYQAATQMTDESGQSDPFTINTLLDRALGPEGYYGAFVANMHTDVAVHAGSTAIVASAQARGVPIVSSRQMLDWIDGRNGSTFKSIAWDGTSLAFTVSPAAGANGLQTMLPASATGRPLTSITHDGSPISYSIQLIKGVSYAMFSSTAGSYLAQYTSDTTRPVISSVAVVPGLTTAAVTWTTSEPATSSVAFGTSPDLLTSTATVSGLTTAHVVQLAGLNLGTTYYYRITSADADGNPSESPAPSDPPGPFTTGTINCPCSIWTSGEVPAQLSADDPSAVELGVRFRPAVDGFITGIRFYKGAANTGTHVGNLWTNAGTLLATAVFSGEGTSGWQQTTLPSPVPVTANTTYVVSYHTDTGGYSADLSYFQSSGVTNGPLQALASGVDGPNGVFKYGSSGFPADTFVNTNYWVDVVLATSLGDTTPPNVVTVTPSSNATGAATSTSVTATFNESLNAATVTSSTVLLRNPANITVPATVTYDASTRTATLQPVALAHSTTYAARVHGGSSGVKDAAGNALAADFTWSFTTSAYSGLTVKDTTTADFGGGAGTGTFISQTADGEVMLVPAAGAEFFGTALPSDWTATAWTAGATTTVTGGQLAADGSRVSLDTLFPSGQSLEFVATFSSDTFEHVGFGVTLEAGTPWALFSTAEGGGLYARTHDGAVPIDTLIPGSWLGAPHRYRIDWNSSSVVFFIDGTQVASHATAIAANMRPIISDLNVGGGALSVDWVRLAPYAAAGTFTSRILDAGVVLDWSFAEWTAELPSGTNLTLSARFGNTAVPDASWTSFMPLTASGAALAQSSQYVQYQATLTGDGSSTPTLQDVTFGAPEPPPPPPVSLSISNVTVVEGNTGSVNADFIVTLSSASSQAVTVAYATANGTATAGSDYVATSGTLTLAPGASTGTIAVPVTGDATIEGNETFVVNLSSPTNAVIADAQGVGTITNDDLAPTPSITINDVSVVEGNGGTTTATFTVTLSSTSGQTVTVAYATANGTATAGSDYVATSGTLTLAPGASTGTIAVPVTGDATVEGNETFVVNLTSPTNAVIADGQGVGTITNDDTANLTITDVSVDEGNSGTTTATFTVTLSTTSSQTVTVSYATANGTAIAGIDYTATSGQLTFVPGTLSLTISVPVLGDTLDEPDETFAVNLSGAVNATISGSQGTGTITNDDTAVLPAITTQPTTETVTTGHDVSFTVAASGIPTPSYQWQISTNSGASWSNLTNTAPYGGVGTATLTVTGAAAGFTGNQYRSVATNVAGSATSVAATLTVTIPVISFVGDFDGDRKADLGVFVPSTGAWSIRESSTSVAYVWGGAGDIPVPGDYDGDGKTDIAVFRPATGVWFIWQSRTQTGITYTWGGAGDIPVPRDYDGDGKADIAVFRPATGVWYIWQSRTQTGITYTWGGGGDIPVPRDYDGDGKTDIAVFRPATGAWFIWQSHTQTAITYTWGGAGDIPVPSDFDGDGKTDIAVFRPSTGFWFIWQSATQTGLQYIWGGGADVPVPGDYDGDGKTDIGVFRPVTGAWFIWQSRTSTGFTTTWGGGGDVPNLKRP